MKLHDMADLKPDKRNANKGTQRGRGMVEASLREVGAGRSIVTDKDGRVIAGNKTLEAAADIGLKLRVVETDGKELVVVQRNDLDLSDDTGAARKLAYFDNQTSSVGLAWDAEILLADLNNGVDLSAMFNQGELDALLAGLVENEPEESTDPGAQTDRAEELQAKWQCADGQLWQIGEHFAICGDCREPETWRRLLAAAQVDKVNGVFTSPPYAMQRKDQYGGVPTAEYVDWWEALQANVKANLANDGSFFVNIKAHCEDGQRVLYCMDLVCAMVRRWGWRFVDEMCWRRKGTPGSWPERLRNDWESIYQFNMDNTPVRHGSISHYTSDAPIKSKKRVDHQDGYWNMPTETGEGVAHDGNVIEAFGVESNTGHSAAFPVALPDFFIRAYSDPGDVWLDPFLGSGTTIVAAHQNQRRGLGSERLPKYMAVILERLSVATNQAPVLLD